MIYEKKFKMLLLKCFIINKKDAIPRPQLFVTKKEGRSRLNRRSRANVIVYRTLDGQSETIAGGYGLVHTLETSMQ